MRKTMIASLAVALGLLTTAHAQSWKVPRTAWGDPDLDGIWNYATMTPLERPRELAAKDTLTAEEAAAFERQTRSAATTPTTPPARLVGSGHALLSPTAARR